jgi:signal peptidase I
MDNKKAILIGSGILAFSIVVYIVIRKFNKGNKPQVFRCPTGYTPANGKCIKTSNTPIDYGDVIEYEDVVGIYDDGTIYDGSIYDGTVSDDGNSSTMVKTKSGARLREKSSTDSAIIKTYDSGVTLVVVGERNMFDGVWYNVQEKSSISSADVKRQGWMRSDVVKDLFADERS